MDYILGVKVYHGYLIKLFHTPHSIFDEKPLDFLCEHDMLLLKLTLEN